MECAGWADVIIYCQSVKDKRLLLLSGFKSKKGDSDPYLKVNPYFLPNPVSRKGLALKPVILCAICRHLATFWASICPVLKYWSLAIF
jgi:hypothetical protein